MTAQARLSLSLALVCCAIAIAGCQRQAGGGRRWRIGFSQVTTTEPWRVEFNKEMRAEAARHPELDLNIADGQDRTDKQVSDVEAFIRQHVDLIMISPKESAGLSGVVDEAAAAGIPVIVLDRRVTTDRFTQFIGADNEKIGEMAGDYARDQLGGKGHAKGNIVELWGGMASSPAQDRHKGFVAGFGNEPGVTKVVEQDGDWKQDRAYNIMAAELKAHTKIDLVYAHNDPMAYGAWLAARDNGNANSIKFIGIDGLPDLGAQWVKQGALTATVLYPPPGAEAIRQAVLILHHKSVPNEINLPTELIDAHSVDAYLAAHRSAAR
jgi:ribose transport system substrate-binding protein